MAKPFFTFTAKLAGFSQLIRNEKGQFASGNQAFAEVNHQSLEWLKKRSTDILDSKVHRYPDVRNKVRLEAIVTDESAHEVTRDYFRFWIPSRVASIDERVVAFYRATDQGSSYWMDSGRYVGLVWYPGANRAGGGGSRPDGGINTQAAYASRAGARVLIKHPVPAYGFLTTPVREFQEQGVYADYVQAAFKQRGIRAKVTKT